MRRLVLILAVLSGLALPASADAAQPGPNGPLVFVSGRDDPATPLINFSDATAQVWFVGPLGGDPIRISTGQDMKQPGIQPGLPIDG